MVVCTVRCVRAQRIGETTMTRTWMTPDQDESSIQFYKPPIPGGRKNKKSGQILFVYATYSKRAENHGAAAILEILFSTSGFNMIEFERRQC